MDLVTTESCYSKDNDREEDEVLLQPYLQFTQIGHARAKYISSMFHCFNYWLKVPQEQLKQIINIFETQYNSFVMLDDIYDGSVARSGVPVMHSIYGLPHTLNSVNYATSNALEKLLDLGDPRIMPLYIEHGQKMHAGNGMEIYWRDNIICPTEKEYLEIAVPKTSSAFCFGIKVMQLFSDNSENLDKLVTTLGQLFQIWNDLVTLKSEKQTLANSFCADITEGTFTFPIIHAIQTHPHDDKIINILKQRTTSYELKKYFVSILEKYGSFDYTLEVLNKLKNEAVQEVERLGGNPYIDNVVEYILDKLETVG
ncbi:unnamed protein product [Tenebrio molitor]|nr:unnamed protein product [Tenebrio molitor]